MFEIIGRLSRKTPLFKGKYKLLRCLLKRSINTRSNVLVKAKNKTCFLLPNINEAIGFSIFINGVYENDHIDFIIRNLPLNGCFIDAGANIGSISIPVAKRRPDVQVIAIEASPRVFRYLQENVELNRCDNITLINKALSNTTNQLTEFYSPDELFGKGSMSPVFTQKSEVVHTITIDALAEQLQIGTINLMKIDVEGYERIVFEGMGKMLRERRVQTVVLEFCSWMENLVKGSKPGSAQELLKNNGFSISLFTNKKLKLLPDILKAGDATLVADYGHE